MKRIIGTLLAISFLLSSCAQAPGTKAAATLVGTWKATVTKADLVRVQPDFPLEAQCENAGTFVWQFKPDGTFAIDQTPLPDCPAPANPHIDSTWTSDGDLVTFAKGTPDQEVYQWTIDGDTLTFKYNAGGCIPCRAVNTANPWKRVGG